MKRLFWLLLLGALGLGRPDRALAQDKPALNTAPPGAQPIPTTPPPPTRRDSAFRQPYSGPPGGTVTPAPDAPLPTPSRDNPNSPSGLEMPGREQARKAAQEYAEQNTKLFIYTGISPGFSSINGFSIFSIAVSPSLGYRLHERVAVGPGISYAYTYNGFGNGISATTNSLGFKLFGQVLVYKGFLIHGEYELTNAQFVTDAAGNISYNPTTRQITPFTEQVRSPLAGLGYRSQISNRFASDILVLYNFNDTFSNRLYQNPVIRINFLFNIGR